MYVVFGIVLVGTFITIKYNWYALPITISLILFIVIYGSAKKTHFVIKKGERRSGLLWFRPWIVPRKVDFVIHLRSEWFGLGKELEKTTVSKFRGTSFGLNHLKYSVCIGARLPASTKLDNIELVLHNHFNGELTHTRIMRLSLREHLANDRMIRGNMTFSRNSTSVCIIQKEGSIRKLFLYDKPLPWYWRLGYQLYPYYDGNTQVAPRNLPISVIFKKAK